MPCRRLKDYLDTHDVDYEVCRHSRAFTAQEIAARTHTKGHTFAKTVIVLLDGHPAMLVLPASKMVDLENVRQATGAKRAFLASEHEFKELFPDCEVGAMPPFGNLYGVEVFIANRVPRKGMISFNAGTHSELLRMKVEDFERLVEPKRIKVAWEPMMTG